MKKLLAPLLAGGLLLGSIVGSQAATFAQFLQMTGAQNFTFTGGNTGTLTSTMNPIFFQYKSGSGFAIAAPLDTNIGANLTFTATANGAPTIPGANSQQFTLTNFTITTGAAQTVGGQLIPMGTVLLSGTTSATNPAGLMQAGTNSSTFLVPAPAPAPNGLNFSSAFINFAGATQNGFSLSLTPGATTSVVGGLLQINAFTAAGTGTFFSTPAANAVPEPGSLALFAGLGVTGSLMVLRRRTRRGVKRA